MANKLTEIIKQNDENTYPDDMPVISIKHVEFGTHTLTTVQNLQQLRASIFAEWRKDPDEFKPDTEIYIVGVFDAMTGVLTSSNSPEKLGTGADFVNSYSEVYLNGSINI